MDLSRTTYRIIFFASLTWCLAIIAPSIALHFGAMAPANFMYELFSRICHQLDSHSLHLFDAKFAVCTRCTAIYFGFFASVIFYPFLLRGRLPAAVTESIVNSPRILFLSLLPVVIDLGLSEIGVYESTLVTRVLTGAIFGITLPFILIPPAAEAQRELRLKFRQLLLGRIRHAE